MKPDIKNFGFIIEKIVFIIWNFLKETDPEPYQYESDPKHLNN